MDWFHCNKCFRKDGAQFFVTSCGHIFCGKCMTLEKCALCGIPCKHLALSDNLKPQEKMFFKSPVETTLKYFNHISQVWRFQKKQTDLLIAFYKHRTTKLETVLQKMQQTVASQDKELSILRKENGELKKFLTILKESPSRYQGSRLTTPRPVGITSPSQSVTPRLSSQHSSQVVSRSSSMESIPYRVAGFGIVEQRRSQGTDTLVHIKAVMDLGQQTHERNSFTSFNAQPILQTFTCSLWDSVFRIVPKWGLRPHKSPYPKQFWSEGEQNYTWLPATSPTDSLPTKADGISQGERSMDHFQIDHRQGVIYTHC